jgi:hypothetical protein
MTRDEIYNLLHKMLDNYFGAIDSVALWDEPDHAMTIDRAADILFAEMSHET